MGAGAVGANVVRQLASSSQVATVALADDDDRASRVAIAVAERGRVRAVGAERWWQGADVAVLAAAAGHHPAMAERILTECVSVVSVSDDVADVRGLLALDGQARERQCSVVVGAGFAPGLSCLMARHAASGFDQVDEIHVAKTGTASYSRGRAYLEAMRGRSLDWRDGVWVRRRAGSGRELCWFPEPVGAKDCYRARAPDALVLVPAFAGVGRVTARVSASPGYRLSAKLPGLGRAGHDDRLGAVRVEVRGYRDGVYDATVLGAVDRPAVAAGAVAAVAAVAAGTGALARPGAAGLAELADPPSFLRELARRGVKVAAFEGTASNGAALQPAVC
ncbi:MAG: hypothetical protein ACR2G7_04060 [Acidimicrobiales bacterium]